MSDFELEWDLDTDGHDNIDSGVATNALMDARRVRFETLAAVESGAKSVDDVLRESFVNPPVKRIRLDQLLRAETGSHRTVKQVMSRVADITGLDVSKATVMWLVDLRTGGKRLQAWCDARRERTCPTPVFPWR